MLRRIRIQNFRCFKDHSLSFEPAVVVVGKNNAGKSSLIEALRLVGAVVNRRIAQFVPAPGWLEMSRFRKGIAPRISQLGLNLESVFHRYGEPPATITATFDSGASVTIYVGKQETIFATIEHASQRVETAAKFRELQLSWVNVLPQIGPLLLEEKLLTDDNVIANLNSRLSSRHFRNQIYRLDDAFGEFKKLAEETWHGLKINPVQATVTKSGTLLSLDVRDESFVAEVGWMGHGLQMWLQAIWFLSRTAPNSAVVLDEPDVYMHPDLQRKLFRLVSKRFQQCIVSTHSVEIMAEAEPSNILIIDKGGPRSRYANDEPGVQMLIENIGGIHNVHLARLWSAKKVILVEGKDLKVLKHLHATLFPDADLPLDALPEIAIGGWSGWPYAVGSSMTLKNAIGDKIAVYCLLDSDYHLDGEVSARYEEAKDRGVRLHIWSRKEIENFLLQPKAIRRVLAARIKEGGAPSEKEILEKMIEICEEERESTEDAFSSAIIQADRKLDVSTANKTARAFVKRRWVSLEGQLSIVSGKKVLSELSKWSQKKYKVAFGAPIIARNLKASEIPTEMKDVITAIEGNSEFQTRETAVSLTNIT